MARYYFIALVFLLFASQSVSALSKEEVGSFAVLKYDVYPYFDRADFDGDDPYVPSIATTPGWSLLGFGLWVSKVHYDFCKGDKQTLTLDDGSKLDVYPILVEQTVNRYLAPTGKYKNKIVEKEYTKEILGDGVCVPHGLTVNRWEGDVDLKYVLDKTESNPSARWVPLEAPKSNEISFLDYPFEESGGKLTFGDVSRYNANTNYNIKFNSANCASADKCPKTDYGGKKGRAAVFDGRDDYIIAQLSRSYNSRASAVALWIKPELSEQTWSTIMLKGNFPDCAQTLCPNRAFALFLNKNGAGVLDSTPIGSVNNGKLTCATSAGAISFGKWNHVAGVIDSDAKVMKIYVNGDEAASCAYDSSGIRTSSGQLRIGGGTAGGSYFKGMMDEFHWYRRALSAVEIKNIISSEGGLPSDTHLACVNQACTKVAGTGANLCTSNAQCQNNANQTHLACSNLACTPVSGAGANTCATNAECQNSTNTHLACVNQACTKVAGTGANLCTSNENCTVTHSNDFELQLFYPFTSMNSQGETIDLSFYRRNGLVNGGNIINSIYGPVMSFSGDDNVEVSRLGFPIGDVFTAGARIKLNKDTGETGQPLQTILSNMDPGTSWSSLALFVNSANKAVVSFYYFNNATAKIVAISNTTLVKGKWYHVAGKFENGMLKIYIDGELDAQTDAGGKVPYTTTNTFYVGSSKNTWFFNGALDDVRLYSRAIDDSEILSWV